jgi:hypothetical protein
MSQVLCFRRRRTTFDPEHTAAMGDAYDAAVRGLGEDLERQGAVRELLARRIIKLAKSGEVNRDRLRETALSGLVRPRFKPQAAEAAPVTDS